VHKTELCSTSTSSVDGFIEVWDPATGRLALDLSFQKEEQFMMHEEPVLCLSFSKDGKLLVSGCQAGRIMIWQLEKGKCLREFARAHTAGVTSVQVDGTQVISTSFDNTLRIHGIQSGKTLKIFRGHTSYVQRASLLQVLVEASDASSTRAVLSASSDGTLRLWDVKTTDCVRTMQVGASTAAITQVAMHPVRQDTFLVCNRSQALHLVNVRAQILASFHLPSDTQAIIQCMAFSPKARYLYAGTDDGYLYCWEASTGRVEHIMRLHQKEVIGLAHHPKRNMLASWAEDGTVQLWRTARRKRPQSNSSGIGNSGALASSSSSSSGSSGSGSLKFKMKA
jgi:WD40 repeat-containing protein SMU1